MKKYVPITLPPKELAHLLTMAGTEVGEVKETGADWDRDRVLVGQVLKVEPHPNADRLTLPTVDLGNGETTTVVCGAPNVAAGQKIAFAREGAKLLSARTGRPEPLKAARIRGVLSAGMVCSEKELGLGEDHTGILVLDEATPVGTPLADYLGDAILDIELTPNRPDCLSMLGVAHEVAALTGAGVSEPDPSYAEQGASIAEKVTVEIADPHLCYRYAASLVTGVTVGPSPAWLQRTLIAGGQRPINNIVDTTNYVMLEYGQPLHAFDFDKVKDGTIIVRAAHPGEELLGLDDETLKLQPPMLAIADIQDAIALAGVVGGADTGVTGGTTSVLIESANFDPANTRRTRTALGLNTEASYRFERGLRADLVPRALRRTTQLVLKVAGGKAARGIIDVYPSPKEPPAVKITRDRIRKVLGVDLDMGRVEAVLVSLGFERSEPSEGGGEVLRMEAPYWRSDIAIEDDMVEEVARIIGYDSMPTTMLSTPIPHHQPDPLRELRESLRDAFAASGVQEVISYSASSLETLAKAEALADAPEPIKIANPMSKEVEYLRTTLRASILDTLSHNRRSSRGEGIRIFEIGRVYLPKEEAKERDLPDEKEILVAALSGPQLPTSWLASENRMGFFDAKGLLESALSQIGVDARYEPFIDPILHPGKTARVVCGGSPVGVVGEVHPRVLGRFDLDTSPVAILEIDIEALLEAVPESGARYSITSRFPDSERDLALIVDASVPSDRVQSVIERHKLVRHSRPFDLYVGEGVPAGKKSIAYRIAFQSAKATLTAEQVDKAQGDILRQLQREVGAELRA